MVWGDLTPPFSLYSILFTSTLLFCVPALGGFATRHHCVTSWEGLPIYRRQSSVIVRQLHGDRDVQKKD